MAVSRRNVLISSLLGAAAVGVHVLGSPLPSAIAATPPSGDDANLPELPPIPHSRSKETLDARSPLTADNILGPYHRSGAPFRGKVTPILAPGDPLLVRGRVWSFDTKAPIPYATVDVWQADANGRYDNDDPASPPKPGVYLNRARMITDEQGFYEYESVRPGRYQLGPGSWRTSHIHYRVTARGHKTLVTQMFFPDDTMNKQDGFIKESLIAPTTRYKIAKSAFWLSTFDIVLAKE
jgi:catechol 1,2-dioxygenase